jgi:RsbT co-antagonist protein rsbRD N-terminal domain
MYLIRLLEKKKSAILKKWLRAIYDTYPEDTSKFLKDENDMFANPVGHAISANAEYILDGLIKGERSDELSPYIEWIIRIRAVQDFTPAQAVSFLNSLKTVIRSQLKPEIRKLNLWDEIEELDTEIDNLLLSAFEIYSTMKEKIYRIRMKELEKSDRFLQRLMESHSR